MKTLGFQGFIWRRGWDSNPCAIARKLISSQPRYDHFDTSPYMLTRHTEINAIFSCIRIPVRTGIVLETMECPKPAWLKGFRRFGFRLAKKISSQPRYDHFDTSPYMLNSILSVTNYSIFYRTGRPVMSCCGVRNFLTLPCKNFDRGHSLLLASSATGSARKRPHFDTSPYKIVKAKA